MKAIMVTDLAFGDSGKGTVVDYLSEIRGGRALVIRTNGGPQASHGVVRPDAQSHRFRLYGSGTFAGAATYVTDQVWFDPFLWMHEREALDRLKLPRSPMLFVHPDARVITPFHATANKIRELLRGDAAHGTCGLGVGEAVKDDLEHPEWTIRMQDLEDPQLVKRRMDEVRRAKYHEFEDDFDVLGEMPQLKRDLVMLDDHDAPELFAQAFANVRRDVPLIDESILGTVQGDTLIFEGAQGVLLDEWRGFHPYTTWSTTTFANQEAFLDKAGFKGERVRLGVIRAYMTRHGAGPFPTEDRDLYLPDTHNDGAGWQGRWRVGWLDMMLVKYAIEVCGGIHGLAVTCLDRFGGLVDRKICVEYSLPDRYLYSLTPGIHKDLDHQIELTKLLEQASPRYDLSHQTNVYEYAQDLGDRLEVPVMLKSLGPTHLDKRATRPLTV